MRNFISLIFLVFLVSCHSTITVAPVVEISAIDDLPVSGIHRVVAGETLYAIAWRYGLDYRSLASFNQIEAPYAIYVGQDLQLSPNKKILKYNQSIAQTSVKKRLPTQIAALRNVKEPNFQMEKWVWPVYDHKNNILQVNNKGMNIVGRQGEAIYATGPGKVVYAGNGLRAYGNLILIKHNNVYLSAYAHNQILLVHEGEWVKQGQKIAEMGQTGTNRVMLHFELRKAGKSFNPLKLLR